MITSGAAVSVPTAAGPWSGATVVASSVYNDDGPVIQTLLLVLPDSPHFQVVIYNPDEGMVAAVRSDRAENIGRAVKLYEEFGGEVYP